MLTQGENRHYDRAFINNLYRFGYQLRKEYIYCSKMKLAGVYKQEYQERISSWKIQKAIELYKPYHNPAKIARIARKCLDAAKRKCIAEFRKKHKAGFLLCFDAVD